MGVNLIFKIAAVGILVSVICQVLKHSGREDQAFLTSLAGLVLVLFWIVPYIYELFETIKNLFAVRKGEGVMTIIQAAVLGITAVALAVQLKPLRQEYSVYLILAAGLVIGFLSISRLELILDTVRAIGSQIRVKNIYLGTLLKMVGITYIAEFASGICRDAGFSALGTQVEMFGKLSILAVSAPVLQALLETLQVFLS